MIDHYIQIFKRIQWAAVLCFLAFVGLTYKFPQEAGWLLWGVFVSELVFIGADIFRRDLIEDKKKVK